MSQLPFPVGLTLTSPIRHISTRPTATTSMTHWTRDATMVISPWPSLARRVTFGRKESLLASTYPLNGLYDYDPTSKVETSDLTKSDINKAGTSLDHNDTRRHDGNIPLAVLGPQGNLWSEGVTAGVNVPSVEYDYDPTSKVETSDLTKSDINKAGTSLDHNATISDPEPGIAVILPSLIDMMLWILLSEKLPAT
jgi:hypothetical protein